jgi:diguanylate cyclase (GGDEF)-like protein/PAS domain S-box-containing protein
MERPVPSQAGEQEARLPDWVMREALASVNIALSIADLNAPDAPLIFVNPAFETLTGYPATHVIGRNCRFLQGPDTSPSARRRLRHAVENRRPTRARLLNYRADGSTFWNEISLVPVRHPTGAVTHMVGLQRDVTPEVDRERALFAASRDVRQALDSAVDLAGTAGHALAIIFVDLDGLKTVNDTYGHAAGDQALIAVADLLGQRIRPGDLVSRYGGDEFVILLDRLEREQARTVAERLHAELADTFAQPLPGLDGLVTASLGLAVYPDDGGDGDELISTADARMYSHKRSRQPPLR